MQSFPLKSPNPASAKLFHLLTPVRLLLTIIYTPDVFPGAFPGSSPESSPGQFNGFAIGPTALIPATEIHHGGPSRDGIPSIDWPKFISAEAADYLHDDDRVLGIRVNNTVKACPVSILNWHEIVNDGDMLISYCPLCRTDMAFKSDAADFGVSGLLYNNDMLLYDRKTESLSESLWSQIPGQAISGERKGESLEMLALQNTSWQHWLQQHPNTWVLSQYTGYGIRDSARIIQTHPTAITRQVKPCIFPLVPSATAITRKKKWLE